MTDTVLDRLVACVRKALVYDQNVKVAPCALLWPDETRQWEPVIDRLGQQLPIVTLGAYEPEVRRGPAYWIRCVVARTIDIGLPEGSPIVYLPGVGRSALRAVERCPAALAPIAELQHRGQWFAHPNGRDWTARALLSHPGRGLGLRISDDPATTDALRLALGRLLDEKIDRLASLLDADFFNELVSPDPMRSLLGWLDDPQDYRGRLEPARWTAFAQQCKSDFGFNPRTDGEVIAARKLAGREGKWASVWEIFASAPERYPGIPDQLGKARPEEQLSLVGVAQSEVWPQDNQIAEDQLRKRLRDFEALTPEGARKEATRLDGDHAWRRRTVWAKLDRAPLAFALEQLAVLAELTAQPLAETDLESLTADYVERGWRADDAAVRALALAPQDQDRAAVAAAVSAMYRWWLDAAAKALLAAIGPMANARTYKPGPPASHQPRRRRGRRPSSWTGSGSTLRTACRIVSRAPDWTCKPRSPSRRFPLLLKQRSRPSSPSRQDRSVQVRNSGQRGHRVARRRPRPSWSPWLRRRACSGCRRQRPATRLAWPGPRLAKSITLAMISAPSSSMKSTRR